MAICGTSTLWLRQAEFLSLLDRSGPFFRAFRHRRFLLRLALRHPLRVRRRAVVALRAFQQFIHFRLRDLRLTQLRDCLHLARIELPICPGALLAKQGREFSGGVGDLFHLLNATWNSAPR